MHAMDKDCVLELLFLTSKWTSVLIKQRLLVCCLSIFSAKRKYLVIGLIENEKNFFMKRKFMDSAEVKLKFVGS